MVYSFFLFLEAEMLPGHENFTLSIVELFVAEIKRVGYSGVSVLGIVLRRVVGADRRRLPVGGFGGGLAFEAGSDAGVESVEGGLGGVFALGVDVGLLTELDGVSEELLDLLGSYQVLPFRLLHVLQLLLNYIRLRLPQEVLHLHLFQGTPLLRSTRLKLSVVDCSQGLPTHFVSFQGNARSVRRNPVLQPLFVRRGQPRFLLRKRFFHDLVVD